MGLSKAVLKSIVHIHHHLSTPPEQSKVSIDFRKMFSRRLVTLNVLWQKTLDGAKNAWSSLVPPVIGHNLSSVIFCHLFPSFLKITRLNNSLVTTFHNLLLVTTLHKLLYTVLCQWQYQFSIISSYFFIYRYCQPGQHNLQSFLAANLTQNYFLIARMIIFLWQSPPKYLVYKTENLHGR